MIVHAISDIHVCIYIVIQSYYTNTNSVLAYVQSDLMGNCLFVFNGVISLIFTFNKLKESETEPETEVK